MPLAAKNEAEKDDSTRILTPAEQLQTMKKPWLRMDGEKTLWYNRFKRYRALGAKRSLQAAFEQEQQEIRVLKSTKEEQKPAAPGQRRARQRKRPHLVEVAKPKQIVPGSWKQASSTWCWVERARAFDEHWIDTIVEQHMDDILSGFAVGIERVRTLQSMYKYMGECFNLNHNKMSYQEESLYIGRMQSLLRDIKEEMALYDPAVTKLALRGHAKKIYEAASNEDLLKGIIAEQKRRAQCVVWAG